MEQGIWDALDGICGREGMTRHEVCSLIESRRKGTSRTSAVRAFIVTYYHTAASGFVPVEGTGPAQGVSPRRNANLSGQSHLDVAVKSFFGT